MTGVTYRNPALLAKSITTLDIVSGGRAVLGIGAAWFEAEHVAYGYEFPPVGERMHRLEDAVQICRAMFGGGPATVSGKRHRIHEALNRPRPITPGGPPILVGGGGEQRTLAIAARYADACNIFGDPAGVRHKLDVLEAHCERADRDPAEISKTRLGALVMADTAADATRLGAEMRSRRNMSMDKYSGYAIEGDRDGVCEQVAALFDAGLDGLIFNMHDSTDSAPSPRRGWCYATTSATAPRSERRPLRRTRQPANTSPSVIQTAGDEFRSEPARPAISLVSSVSSQTAAMFPAFGLGALALQMGDDLGFAEAGLGSAVAFFFLLAAVTSPHAGTLTDRLGPQRSLRVANILSGLALLGVATVVRSYWLLLAALAVGAIGLTIAGPGTKTMVARGVEVRRHGLAFGIQAAAVPLSVLLAGLAVPAVGHTLGWRWAFGFAVVVPLAGLVLAPPYRAQPGHKVRTGGAARGLSKIDYGPLNLIGLAAALGSAAATTMAAFFVSAATEAGLAEGLAEACWPWPAACP